jgi:excisionase family DNA binding protein
MRDLQDFNPFLNPLLSKQQAAKMLDVSVSTLDRMMNAKTINFVRIGLRRIGFRREDIHDYILRNLDSPNDQMTQENASTIAI